MVTTLRTGVLGGRTSRSAEVYKTLLMLVLAVLVGSLMGVRRAAPLDGPVVSASAASQSSAGHSVTDLRIVLDPARPTLVESVRVQVASPNLTEPTSVQVQAGSGATWRACERTPASPTWTCPTPGLAARDAAHLTIIAR